MRKFLILGFFFAFTAQAVTLLPIPKQESFFSKLWRCNFHISCYSEQKFGTTLTTITGGTLVSDLDTILTTNFTNLNNGKVENATSSMGSLTTLANLATVGTITSGTWNASTLTVSFGGTGSTTLSANQVLLGSSTNAVNVVNGYGTSGQFLTSNGSGLAPTWTSASFDVSLNYILTGNWNFTGTTRIKNFNASSTVANPIVLNGVSLNTPSTQGASSTALVNDGSGNLVWDVPSCRLLVATTTASATTTFRTGTFTAYNSLLVDIFDPGGTNALLSMNFNGDGDGATGGNTSYGISEKDIFGVNTDNKKGQTYTLDFGGANSTTSAKYVTMKINNQPTQRKFANWQVAVTSAAASDIPWTFIGSGNWSNTSNAITSILVRTDGLTSNGVNAGATIRVRGCNGN